jgi:hypothetical protein
MDIIPTTFPNPADTIAFIQEVLPKVLEVERLLEKAVTDNGWQLLEVHSYESSLPGGDPRKTVSLVVAEETTMDYSSRGSTSGMPLLIVKVPGEDSYNHFECAHLKILIGKDRVRFVHPS